MMKGVKNTVLAAAVALLLGGCFKKVSNDTVFILKPNLIEVSGGEASLAEGVTAYAWFDKGSEWSVASYDDALAFVLTDTENGTTAAVQPDAEASADSGHEGMLRLETRSSSVLLLMVYPAAEMYAWRVYATAENLSPTFLTVQFRPWKTSGYTDSGWTVDGVFRQPEPEEPESPEEPEEESEDDDSPEE